MFYKQVIEITNFLELMCLLVGKENNTLKLSKESIGFNSV